MSDCVVPIELAFRFCPRCGHANDQVGSIPFRCPKCGMAQFFGPVAAVGGLVVDEIGQLLMVRRARDPGRGKWGLPGGFVDRDETIEDALRREVREETDLELKSTRLLMSSPNKYVYTKVAAPVIDLFFVCTVVDSQSVNLAEDELDYFEWCVPRIDHLENMAFPSNRKAIERWLKER